MLIRLVPEQIGEGWDVVRPLLAAALPPTLGIRSEAMGNILKAFLTEEAQLWVYYRSGEVGPPLGVVMSAVMTDPVSISKYLLIYTATVIGNVSDSDYEEALDTLRGFADGNGCGDVLAYVEDDRFVERLRRVGGVKISNLVRL